MLTHWKRDSCWERLKAGGEGDDRRGDGWMASPTRWTWVWASSGRYWRTRKPGVLQSMVSKRVGHDWATERQLPHPKQAPGKRRWTPTWKVRRWGTSTGQAGKTSKKFRCFSNVIQTLQPHTVCAVLMFGLSFPLHYFISTVHTMHAVAPERAVIGFYCWAELACT